MQPGEKPKLGSGDREEAVTGLLANLSLKGLGPKWIRPFPPRFPVLHSEVSHILIVFICSSLLCFGLLVSGFHLRFSNIFQLEWLIPDNVHELVWDHGMCADTSRGAAVRDLIAKALKGPLAPAQYEVFTTFCKFNTYAA